MTNPFGFSGQFAAPSPVPGPTPVGAPMMAPMAPAPVPAPVQFGGPPQPAPSLGAVTPPRFAPSSVLMSDEIAEDRLPFIPIGTHLIEVVKTEVVGKQGNKMAVEVKVLQSDNPEAVGNAYRRIYSFAGAQEWMAERASKEWNSFAVRAAGYADTDALKAAGYNTAQLYDACAAPPGYLAGRKVLCRVFANGRHTKPKVNEQGVMTDPGGRPLTSEQWGVFTG